MLKRSSGARQKACVKKHGGREGPAELRSFLLRIMCDVVFCASHAPVQVSRSQKIFTSLLSRLQPPCCSTFLVAPGSRENTWHSFIFIYVYHLSYIMTQERSLYVLRSKHLVLSCRPCHFASGFVCRDRSRRPRESEWQKNKLHFYGSPKIGLGDTSLPLKYERSWSKFSPLASCYDSKSAETNSLHKSILYGLYDKAFKLDD